MTLQARFYDALASLSEATDTLEQLLIELDDTPDARIEVDHGSLLALAGAGVVVSELVNQAATALNDPEDHHGPEIVPEEDADAKREAADRPGDGGSHPGAEDG